ncbi:hypothetical protein EDD21DRAFT_392512 [Dissophora ornata]|nr:hypothetical protein EDD21DRAFT_392512 [Dissophora ornata]
MLSFPLLLHLSIDANTSCVCDGKTRPFLPNGIFFFFFSLHDIVFPALSSQPNAAINKTNSYQKKEKKPFSPTVMYKKSTRKSRCLHVQSL